MTDVKVVDVSAVAAVLFGEAEAAAVADRLSGFRLCSTTLFGFELANVCAMKCRRTPDQRDALLAAYQLRSELGIDEIEIDHDEVLKLALRTELTAYDASYLALARRLGVELVTLDKQLIKSAAET